VNEGNSTVFIGADHQLEKMAELASMAADFMAKANIGDEAELPVAVCSTDRVVYDPVDRITTLKCCVLDDHGVKRLSVKCPAYPGGILPGVWAGGMPILAARDMKPYKVPARSGRRWHARRAW